MIKLVNDVIINVKKGGNHGSKHGNNNNCKK